MGRTNDKKNILIIFLLVIIFVMSVGFALLGSNLKVTATGTVSGDWDVHFVSETFEPITKTDGVKVLTAQLDSNKLSLTLNTTFEKPGDIIEYQFKIENTGSIDAYLKNVVVEGKTENTDAIKLTYNVKANDKQTTYAAGSIIGNTPQVTTTPNITTSLLNKQTVVNEQTTTENNYLTVTLEYLTTADTVANDASATYTLNLQYEQTTAN